MRDILIIGCGAIAQNHHIPLLRKLKRKIYLCDSNPKVINKNLSSFPFSTDYRSFIEKIDGALICTGHSSHFPIAIDILNHKKNVLVEKPCTITFDDCKQLSNFEQDFLVGAGYFRRYIPNFSLLKEIIKYKKYGEVLKIEIDEGGVYGWPVMSNSFWKKETAGGGVLIDTGSHSVDLVSFLFDGNIDINDYLDDSRGGVEANAYLTLKSNETIIKINLSRNRPMSNTMKIFFKNGIIVFNATNGEVTYKENIIEDFEPGEHPDDTFLRQLNAWINPMQNNLIQASDVLKTVQIIEDCYNKEYDKF